MDQSDVSPSMRGILSAGTWKILNSTPGRASANPLDERPKNSATAHARKAILQVILIDSASILRYTGRGGPMPGCRLEHYQSNTESGKLETKIMFDRRFGIGAVWKIRR